MSLARSVRRSRVLATAFLSSLSSEPHFQRLQVRNYANRAYGRAKCLASARAEGTDLRRRDGDAAPGADPRDEQAPAARGPLADGLLPAAAAPAGRRDGRSPGDRPAARGRFHRLAWRRAGARTGHRRAAVRAGPDLQGAG